MAEKRPQYSNEVSPLSNPIQTPFDSVENAKEYIRLLVDAVADARRDVDTDIAAAEASKSDRRLQALRLVRFKLDTLERHLNSSGRTLNDLRTLRRLLLQERFDPAEVAAD